MSDEDKRFLMAINGLKNMSIKDLNKDNYLHIFKLALYLEEFQENQDLGRFEIENSTIEFYKSSILNDSIDMLELKIDKILEDINFVKKKWFNRDRRSEDKFSFS